MLPDRSVLIGQNLVENAKIQKFKCDILSNFQTIWSWEKLWKILLFLHFRNGPTKLFSESWKHKKILAYYMVPAFLYCLYNNLTFQNLKIFDPTTYFMFMQMRLLMTGVIYQFLFNRKLSGRQWISLLILTLGCILQRIENYAPNLEAFHAVSIGSGLLLIALQVFEFFH